MGEISEDEKEQETVYCQNFDVDSKVQSHGNKIKEAYVKMKRSEH